jgi:hypothetical protein
MRRVRISIRSLMIATLIFGLDFAVLARCQKHNPLTDDGGVIIVAVILACLNVLSFVYVWIVAKAVRTPQADQSPLILSMGCLLATMLVLAVPIILIVLNVN